MLVRLNHVARYIVNANHGVDVTGCEALRINCVWLRLVAIPEPTERQRIGNDSNENVALRQG